MSRRGDCHDNPVAERGKKPAAIFLIASKFFITVGVVMALAIICHRLNMKANIIMDFPHNRRHILSSRRGLFEGLQTDATEITVAIQVNR